MTDDRPPLLSAIVIAQNNEATIATTVRSIVEQVTGDPFEVILVDSGTDNTCEIVRTRFPSVRIVSLATPALPGRARNAGLAVARGAYVSFPGSHTELPPGSLEARMEAHAVGYPMVTGAILNGTDTPAGWASYFVDHAFSLPGMPTGPVEAPPSHCSYDRSVLMETGGFPEDRRAGEDTVVNQRLWDEGHRGYRDTRIRLTHVNRCQSPWRLACHHFTRGRALGQIMRENGLGADSLAGYRKDRLAKIDKAVQCWGRELSANYAKARMLVRLAVLAAWLGARWELGLRAKPN